MREINEQMLTDINGGLPEMATNALVGMALYLAGSCLFSKDITEEGLLTSAFLGVIFEVYTPENDFF